MGPRHREEEAPQGTAGNGRTAAAAAFRRSAGDDLRPQGQQYRQTDAGGAQDRGSVECACDDLGAKSLADRDAGATLAAGGERTAA